MTVTKHDAPSDARYWPVPILRAVPLLVLGLIITFVNNHSTAIGLSVFGATTVVGGLVLVVASRRYLVDPGSRSLATVQGVVSIAFGVLALVLNHGQIPALVGIVTGWAILSGALELVTGLRRRGRSELARDWMIVGILTLVLVVAYLLVPTDYSKELGGIEKIKGTLTAATILVGLLGAYGALVGVFLVIQGLSLKWQTGTPEATLPPAHDTNRAHDTNYAHDTNRAHDTNIDGAHRP